MYKTFILFLLSVFFIISCSSFELHEPQKYDYTTSGALTDYCFQVIIIISPDKDIKTMSEQRENAYIKARNSISSETVKQMLNYYSANSLNGGTIPEDKVAFLEKRFNDYSKYGVIDQEYYLPDNSAVLIFRVFKTGIKNDILNN